MCVCEKRSDFVVSEKDKVTWTIIIIIFLVKLEAVRGSEKVFASGIKEIFCG